MKPLQLTMQGINSYRDEQTVDFSELTAYGLFGIFGPTGSGKSSILDAIILALYAKLPRSTKNFININEKKATVSFTFSITTDETKKYKVERTFRYQGRENALTVHNTGARLLDITAGEPEVLADRPTDTTQECIHLLGLNSDDFMRTVVLPQGQFSEFLKLKNKERRSMLQRIFHLEQYGEELNHKISSARYAQELEINTLEGELKSYAPVTAEAVQSTQKALSTAKDKLKKGSRQQEELTQLFKKKDAVRSLLDEYEPLLLLYNEQTQQQEQMQLKQEELLRAKRANQLKPLILQAKNAEKGFLKASALLNELKTRLSENQLSCDELRRERDAFLLSYSTAFETSLKRQQRLKSALQLSRSAAEYQIKKSEVQSLLKKAQSQKGNLTEKREQLLIREAALKNEIASLEKESEETAINQERKAELEKGYILEEQYREKRRSYENKRKSLQRQSGQLAQAKEKQQQIIQQANRLMAYGQERHATLEKQLAKIEQMIAGLLQEKTENEALFSYYQEEHMASLLRSSLKEGEPCPVCGSIHHPSVQQETDMLLSPSGQQENEYINPASGQEYSDKEFADRRKYFEQAERKLQEKKNQTSLEITTLQNELASLENLVKSKDVSSYGREKLSTGICKSASEKGMPEYNEDRASAKHPSTFPPSFPELIRSVRETCNAFSASQGGLNSLVDQCSHSGQELQDEHRLLSETLKEITKLRKELQTESCTKELEAFREAERKYGQLQKELQKKRRSAEAIQPEKEKLQDELAAVSSRQEGYKKQCDSFDAFIAEQLRQFPEDIPKEADHESMLQNCEKELQQLNEKKEKLEKTFHQLEEENQLLREKVSAAASKEEQSGHHAKETSLLLKQQKRSLGFEEEASPDKWYLAETEIQKKEAELERFFKEQLQAKERLQYLEEKLDGQTCSKEEWQKTKNDLSLITEQNDQLERQITVLEHEKQTLTQRLEQKCELEKQLKARLHRSDLLMQLIRLFKGNTFIEYMAESRLSYIAREASDILFDISLGNYTLEINDASEFIIRDNKNGGILRPCDTLSGGEIFITSLALALALSSTIQLNGTAPLELFFLDEGFGSLDNELLDVVMTSLEQLQNQRRSIGIITHVDEIRSRVPVKLLVEPSREGEAGSQIRMEYT